MNLLRTLTSFSLLWLAACGGSGGTADSRPGTEPGSVVVVVDTRSGGDTLVQFQVAGATLEDAAGLQTPNLLRQAEVVTFDDPNGESSGLRLWSVPSARYEALHLILVPGSGYALEADGDTRAVQGPVDVRVPIAGGLLHSATASSWLVIGHDATPVSMQGNQMFWSPSMTARLDGEAMVLDGLELPAAYEGGVAASARGLGNALVRLEWQPGCVYTDDANVEYPDVEAFLDALDADDRLCVDADVCQDGCLWVRRVRRGPRDGNVRLIGRVTSIDGGERFKMLVRATNWFGDRRILEIPEEIVVLADQACFARPNGAPLTYGDLAVGKLAKVYWRAKKVVPGGLDEYTAFRVELPGTSNGQLLPQWHGKVFSVDLPNDTIVIERRNGQPFVVQGQQYPQAFVVVGPETVLERRATNGPGVAAIPLEQVQPGVDFVWVRGEVTTAPTVAASRVRVRAK